MIKALVDKVIVQEMNITKSKGGLIIPDSVQQPQSFGKVMSIGSKVESKINVGDILVFHVSGGMAMIVEGKVLRCLMEAEIYGLVESEEIIEQLSLCEVKQSDLDTIDAAMNDAKKGAEQSRIVRV